MTILIPTWCHHNPEYNENLNRPKLLARKFPGLQQTENVCPGLVRTGKRLSKYFSPVEAFIRGSCTLFSTCMHTLIFKLVRFRDGVVALIMSMGTLYSRGPRMVIEQVSQ